MLVSTQTQEYFSFPTLYSAFRLMCNLIVTNCWGELHSRLTMIHRDNKVRSGLCFYEDNLTIAICRFKHCKVPIRILQCTDSIITMYKFKPHNVQILKFKHYAYRLKHYNVWMYKFKHYNVQMYMFNHYDVRMYRWKHSSNFGNYI